MKKDAAASYIAPTMTLEEYWRREAAGTLPKQAMSTARAVQDALASAAVPSTPGVASSGSLG